jgi:hypothetical protein
MRNLFYTLLLLFAGQAMMAQSQEVKSYTKVDAPVMTTSSQKTAMVVDTLDDYIARATAFYTLTAQGGYVLGTLTGLLETAEHYDNPGGSTNVTEVLVFAATKAIMGAGPDSITVNIYPAGPDSMPIGLPSGTGKFSMADFDTTGAATFVPIVTTIPLTGGFLVSVVHDLAAGDDTLAILSSNVLAQGGGPDGALEKRLRQNTAGGWQRGWDIWTIANANLDADAMIIPIVDVTLVGVDPNVVSSGFQLFRSYPNPSVNELHIPYSIDATQPVNMMLIDATGRIIMRENGGEQAAGTHEWLLNTSDLAAGAYYYVLSVGSQQLGGKFVQQ